jgi:hypothetical protein
MIIRALRYVPPGLPPALVKEKLCIRCGVPILARSATKVRCNECQAIRNRRTQAKAAAKLKAKRREAAARAISGDSAGADLSASNPARVLATCAKSEAA